MNNNTGIYIKDNTGIYAVYIILNDIKAHYYRAI